MNTNNTEYTWRHKPFFDPLFVPSLSDIFQEEKAVLDGQKSRRRIFNVQNCYLNFSKGLKSVLNFSCHIHIKGKPLWRWYYFSNAAVYIGLLACKSISSAFLRPFSRLSFNVGYTHHVTFFIHECTEQIMNYTFKMRIKHNFTKKIQKNAKFVFPTPNKSFQVPPTFV